MKYLCGTEVFLADEIMASYGPDQKSLARVVAIGLDLALDEIDKSFYDWAKNENIITDQTVVIEWVEKNPMSHNNLNFAPVGNYMTLSSLSSETFKRRGK